MKLDWWTLNLHSIGHFIIGLLLIISIPISIVILYYLILLGQKIYIFKIISIILNTVYEIGTFILRKSGNILLSIGKSIRKHSNQVPSNAAIIEELRKIENDITDYAYKLSKERINLQKKYGNVRDNVVDIGIDENSDNEEIFNPDDEEETCSRILKSLTSCSKWYKFKEENIIILMLVRWKKFEKIEEEAMNISLFSSVILFQMNSSYKLTTFTYSNNMKLENTIRNLHQFILLKLFEILKRKRNLE
ncbi:Hypothetical protein SRAE_0000046700 [Strongyloides ratti]|uniref:Uncharacterized protein n=1 Tax=Strongyloides ratti TaxID=34506 RepID=A0A090KV98_STRRB|nr:Hypothetical protein SRAE_0000046700 [Strongyloides ratti]CEF61341.1 Hypothetical protein SRAE_0000046700 [Strongyloides ratti]